jgi:hypothetical protein
VVKSKKVDNTSYLTCKNNNLCKTFVRLPVGVKHVVLPKKRTPCTKTEKCKELDSQIVTLCYGRGLMPEKLLDRAHPDKPDRVDVCLVCEKDWGKHGYYFKIDGCYDKNPKKIVYDNDGKKKKGRKCGNCSMIGHTKRNCPLLKKPCKKVVL